MDPFKIAEEVYKFANEKFITPDFLRNVERWARYQGEKIYVGDNDISVTDLGVWIRKKKKTQTGDDELDSLFDIPALNKPKEFSVSLLEDHATCHVNNKFILLAENKKDHKGELRFDVEYPPKLVLYCISEDSSDLMMNESYPEKPTLGRLKKDFESGEYFYSYNSMLQDKSPRRYNIREFNDNSNLIADWALVAKDLYYMNSLSKEDAKFNPETIQTTEWEDVKEIY